MIFIYTIFSLIALILNEAHEYGYLVFPGKDENKSLPVCCYKTDLTEKPGITSSIGLTDITPYLNNAEDTSFYSIPLFRIGRLLVLEASIDGEEGNLIFDTGATNLVLNRTYFRDHVSSGTEVSQGITGGTNSVDQITANTLIIDDFRLENVPAHLADLGHIENRRGIKVLGLFGFELIKSFEIRIDLSRNRLMLFPIDKRGNLLDEDEIFKGDYFQKAELSKNVLFIRGEVGGKTLRFCFDTGAETNALSSTLGQGILQNVSITRTVRLQGSGQSSKEVIYGILNSFSLGDRAIENMQTIITSTGHLEEAYGVHIDGVLGYDFITRGNFCINFVKNQVGIAYLKNEEI